MSGRIGGGKMEWIRLGDLKPHPKAQRPFDQKWASEIAENFDPEKLQIILVSRTKGGRNYIVDGQHSSWAALQFVSGDCTQSVLCRVFEGDDDAEAAGRFLDANNKRGVNALAKFNASVVRKDADAVAIVAVLEKYGLRVAPARDAGIVLAVDALRGTFNRQRGALILEAVIRTLHEAWGKNPDAYSGQLIRGLALVFVKWGDAIDGDVLARKLAKSGTAIDWLGRARSLAGAMGISIAQAIAECVRNEYNKGRRTDRLGDAESAA